MKYFWLLLCLLSPTAVTSQVSTPVNPLFSKTKQISGTWILETLAIEPYRRHDLEFTTFSGLFWDDASGLFLFSFSDSLPQKGPLLFQLLHESDQQDEWYDGLFFSSADSLFIKLDSDTYSVDIVGDTLMSLKKRIANHSNTLHVLTLKKIPSYSDLSPSNKIKMDRILSKLDGTWNYKEVQYAANPHCVGFSCPTCLFNKRAITSNIFHFDSQKSIVTVKDHNIEYPFLLYFYYDYIYIRLSNHTYSIQQLEHNQLQLWLENTMSCPYYFVLERF